MLQLKKTKVVVKGPAVLLILLLATVLCGCPGLFAGPETYKVTYDANGATAGLVPADGTAYEEGETVTVLDNTGGLSRTGYSFVGWNTRSDGDGTSYAPGSTFVMGTADMPLYAEWTVDVLLTISSSAATGYTKDSSFSVTFLFSKEVTGFESGDVSVVNGSLSGFSGTGNSYSATVTPASEGDVVVSAADGAATDSYGFTSRAAACTVCYDLTAPGSIKPVITAAGDGKLTVSWTEPTDDPSFHHVLVSYNESPQVQVEKGTTSYTFRSLETGISYCPLLKAVDAAGNASSMEEGQSLTIHDNVYRNVYIVKSAAELAAMADDLNGYYVLQNNITVSSWTPVGTASSPFTGIIDGLYGLTISGMSVSAGSYSGLLGRASSAYIRKLKITGATIPTTTGSEFCGILAGSLENSRVEDVDVSGSVGTTTFGTSIGGLAGYIAGTSVISCRVRADVKGYEDCGGLAGTVGSTSVIQFTSVEGLSSPGLEATYFAGGIAGNFKAGNLTIDQCFSNMDIRAESDAGYNIGGLCGNIASHLIVSDSYARGSVYNTDGRSTGGLFGFIGNNASVTCSRTYAEGPVTGDASYTGGLFGSCFSSTLSLSEVYFAGSTTQTVPGPGYTEGTLIGDEDLKAFPDTAGWDTAIWGADSGLINDGYPILRNIQYYPN